MKCNKVMKMIMSGMFFFTAACGTSGSQSVVTLETARKYLSEGNYEEAIEAFTALINIEPQNTVLYMERADAYVYAERYQEAVSDYTFVIDNGDPESTAVINRGVIHYVLGELEDGDADLATAAEMADGSEENKDAGYNAVIELLERLNIEKVSEEDNNQFKADVYELPDGSHLLLVRLGDDVFAARSYPEGTEVPDISLDNALYFFDWYSPEFLWFDPETGDSAQGNMTVDFHEDGTMDISFGDRTYTYPYYYQDSGMYQGYYLIGGSGDPLDAATAHYALFGEFDDFWGLIIGATHEADEDLFVAVMPD